MGHIGAFIGLSAVLIIIIVIVFRWLVLAIGECLESLRWRLSRWWEKIPVKKSPKIAKNQVNLQLYPDIELSKNQPPPIEENYLSGTCEICGNKFSSSSSNPDKFLKIYTFSFYGKKRTRLVCNRCLRIMREEGNVICDSEGKG